MSRASDTVNTTASEQFEFYYTMRSQIGTGGVKRITSEQATWRDVRRTLENSILGPSTASSAESASAVALQTGARQRRRDDSTMLRGKVVANVQSHRDDVPADCADWLQRAKLLPYLVDRSLLESGDVLLLARVPRSSVAHEKVYGRPRHVAHSEVPKQWQHYVRRAQTRAERDARRPRLLGQHQWLAPDGSGAGDGSDFEPLKFDESMSEAARLEALLNHQPYKFSDNVGGPRNRVSASRNGSDGSQRTRGSSDNRERRLRGEEPPETYVCRRCNVAGHWIQECPTRQDRAFDRATLVPMHGMARSLFRRLEDKSLLHDPEAKIFYDQLGRYYVKKSDVIDRARATGNRQFARLARLAHKGSKRAAPTCSDEKEQRATKRHSPDKSKQR